MAALGANSSAVHTRTLDYLKGVGLFSGIAVSDVDQFARVSHTKQCKKGQLIHSEEDSAEHFYVVRSGWVKLSHTTEDGTEIVLGMQNNGSVAGEQAAFDHGRYTCTMQIAEDAELIQLSIAMLKKQLRGNIQLAHNIMNIMAQSQRRNELQLIQYLLYSAPQRIGCFLLKLCGPGKLEDGMMLVLPYDKAHIASVLGMRAATFSRALKTLREETGIHIAGARVKIASVERLRSFVGDCYLQTHYRS